MKKDEPVKKVDLNEVKKEMKNIWRKKEETGDKGEYVPSSGVDVSSKN